MNDQDFEHRTKAIEWMVNFVGPPREVFAGKRVVEIGAGFGVGAIAAIRNGASYYLGIEPSPFGVRVMQLENADPLWRLHYERAADRVGRDNIRFFQGFAHEWPTGDFDICLVADVLEHVPDPLDIAQQALRLLKPGGHVIASTAPLYYSANGHHLFDALRDKPWGHLYANLSLDGVDASEYLLDEFSTLNGITHLELVKAFNASGLEIVRERTLPEEAAEFAEYEHLIADVHRLKAGDEPFTQCVSQIYARRPTRPALLSRLLSRSR